MFLCQFNTKIVILVILVTFVLHFDTCSTISAHVYTRTLTVRLHQHMKHYDQVLMINLLIRALHSSITPAALFSNLPVVFNVAYWKGSNQRLNDLKIRLRWLQLTMYGVPSRTLYVLFIDNNMKKQNFMLFWFLRNLIGIKTRIFVKFWKFLKYILTFLHNKPAFSGVHMWRSKVKWNWGKCSNFSLFEPKITFLSWLHYYTVSNLFEKCWYNS